MNREQKLAAVRRAYAKRIMAAVGLHHPRVEAAFAAVEREHYLGPGPWLVLRSMGYISTPDDNPVHLYDDILVGIVPERGLNNGMPSYHAPLMASADIQAGEHVVHIGAGVGYYTAILAHLAGAAGKVTAIEFDAALAARATANLADASNVQVYCGDGFSMAFDAADVIYVNAGATHPADIWLDRLKDGGRMILPLTTDRTSLGSVAGHGVVFRIERKGEDYFAGWISTVGLYPCEGGRDDAAEAALETALCNGGWRAVTRLYRSEPVPDDRCWLRGNRWALAYD